MANSDMIVRVQADTKNYDANLAKASKTLKQFADNNLSMGGILKQSTGALTGMAASVLSVTAAIGAAKKVMGDMVRINMQFEQSSSNLAAVLGTSRDQITALTDQAKQLGATTQYTASQILELQANLARLGFNQNEILNSTKSVQAMATAMGADLGEAANLAGSALRGFGLNATEMERVASVLSVGTTKSALSFEKLATALPVVQTAAAKTGFTIEDTVAMLGKLTDNGINAASAATQLRKILNDSTTAGTKLANALGGPVKSFDELVVALDKAGKAGQNHADSVALVNSKNATALDILRDMAQQREVDVNGVKKQTSALQELRDSITDCSDGMKSMQDEQLNTLQGSITILNSAWEGLMLTFSESNGVIKTVVDSLTDLLGAWTKWRQRNAGGDSAIKSYQLYGNGLTQEAMQAAQSTVNSYKAGGTTDKQMAEIFNKEKKALEDQSAAMMEVYEQYRKIREENGLLSKEMDALAPKIKEAFKLNFDPTSMGRKEWDKLMTSKIAPIYDDIAVKDYQLSLVTAPEPGKKTASEEGDQEDKTKGFLQKRKAQIEAEEKLEISKLDRMAMAEEEYEKKVYEIKRAALEQIAKLYQEDTTDRAKAEAAISSLDIQYQGTQMRLANKGTSKGKTYEKQEGPSGYSQEGISALRSEIQSRQKSMQMGSQEYMVEANRLVDLTTFENLLKTAVQRGVELDPALLEASFEKIDLGLDVPAEEWQNLVDIINEQVNELNPDPIKLDVQTGGIKELKKEVSGTADQVNLASQAFNSLGSAMSQIDDPGTKVAGLVAQAIGSVVAGYGSASAQAGESGNPWVWLAFAISGLATMVSIVAGIKEATSGLNFASGGIIPGNSFSGDNMRGILPNGDLVGLDAGEVILNRAQQGTLAGQLQGNPMGDMHLSTEISGSNLRVVLNNDNRQRGGSRGFYSEIH